jgi:hypothetical protein
MEPEAEKLQIELQQYRFLLSRVTGRLAVEALKRLIGEGEARLRAASSPDPSTTVDRAHPRLREPE